MHYRALFCSLLFISSLLAADPETLPQAGPVQLFPESAIKPGMHGTAWTVFQGTTPEPVPIEIIGIYENAWGPKQDIILARMLGKAIRTNVAGGMSGSPVYIDGKLVGAVSLRLSTFSPDAICGITPIQLMLDVKDFDTSKPSDSRTPDKIQVSEAGLPVPSSLFNNLQSGATMVPIATPVSLSGFTDEAVKLFTPVISQLGLAIAQGGSEGGALKSPQPTGDWRNALKPGEGVAAVLVSGDMTITGGGTVTYNDGRRILAFGHPMFNLGPVNMPLAKANVLRTLASSYQPTKIENASEVVGALHQDRHSAIEGELGATAQMIPVTMKVRSYNADNSVRKTRDFHFDVFVDQKWTPYLRMATLFNSLSQLNDFSEEATYRLHGELKLAGQQRIELTTMQAPAETQIPTPMLLAGWSADQFNRRFVHSSLRPKP